MFKNVLIATKIYAEHHFFKQAIPLIKMKDEVSVIIPTLNEEKTIKDCLNDLLNQKQKPFEIIVVDNGSTDKTQNIVNSLKNKFKNKSMPLKLFYYPKGNQKDAREFGIRKAKGTIIGSLDADACPDSDWISKIKEHLKDKKIVGIGGKSRFRNKGLILNFFYTLTYYLRLVFNLYCLGGGNSAFRKSIFVSVKGYRGLDKLRKEKGIIYVKDDYFLSKNLERKGKLKFCPDLTVSLLYRVRRDKNYKKSSSILDVLKRSTLEIIYDYRITRHFKKSPISS